MMGQFRIGIERNSDAQLVHRFLGLVIEQQGLAQDAVFGRPGRILTYGEPQLGNSAVIILLRHVRAGQAGVSLLPLRMLAVEVAQFFDGSVELSLIAISVAQIIADRGFRRRDPLGFSIFADRFVEIALLVQNQRQVGVGFPKRRTQADRLLVSCDRSGNISIRMERNAHVVIGVGVIVIAFQRFGVGVNRGLILSVRVKAEAEILISLGVFRVDAERGAGFGDGVRAIIE